MDINMPKLDGFECMKKIKEDPRFDVIPIIMLTSSENDEDVVQSYKNGAVSFIKKPVNYEDFLKAVEEFNNYWLSNKFPNS
jgi:two-component system response regulator